ncbi:molybdate ABC transporter substrate-binding protein [Citreimonas salinaria]|uniref:Molybdate transport system substrate-binding protein n=1 Tax=Citreimonas salinaria TaxID=321339 RepID=A0A1H3MSR1_9RHOB|nr:molybdate ABC transporter substrate-binding protein [Citreimonas salinaria]SDY79712.1 molybdate transport system substrate-binding protein [Citreimonas salinaria]
MMPKAKRPVGPRPRLSAARAIVVAFGLPAVAAAEQVTVFAAASLADALAEIETAFEDATGHDLVVSLAGSSALARQIRQRAPADIFISASTDWMDAIEADGLIEPGTRFDLLGNSLVLIAFDPDAAPVEIEPGVDLSGILGDGRLAMALVDAVPAGIYGKLALQELGMWDDVADRVAQANNVRGALALVARGEAPFGIVYASDALAEPAVTVVGAFPAATHPPIVYPVADLSTRDVPAEADFLAFLRGPAAREVFARQGFAVLTE